MDRTCPNFPFLVPADPDNPPNVTAGCFPDTFAPVFPEILGYPGRDKTSEFFREITETYNGRTPGCGYDTGELVQGKI